MKKYTKRQQKAVDQAIAKIGMLGNSRLYGIDSKNRPVVSGVGFFAVTSKGKHVPVTWPMKEYYERD